MNILPVEFINQITALYPKEADLLLEAIQNPPLTSVRLNPAKKDNAFSGQIPVPWCEDAFYLRDRPSFIMDPLFHAGAYYVQESSGMFLQTVLNQLPGIQNPLIALDLCAAPGGKSTLIQSVLHPKSVLVSNEIIKTRVQPLIENMLRWGLPNQIITNNDPRQIGQLSEIFDLLVVDAPCSGEGLFRRDPMAMKEWSMDQVMLCAGRQQRILSEALPALKPGGFLIYSTCTFNHFENEDIINWLIREKGLSPFPIEVPPDWGITKVNNHSFKFLPHLVKGEGLFMAILQKPGGASLQGNRKKEPKLNFVSRKLFPQLQEWLNNPDDFDFVTENDFIYAIPKTMLYIYGQTRQHLYVKHAGICMGKMDKTGALIPEHHLALSTCLSGEINSIAVNKEQAIAYLRKIDFEIKDQHEPGWYVLKYKGLALGWIKLLPNRINNYLPAAYRILREVD